MSETKEGGDHPRGAVLSLDGKAVVATAATGAGSTPATASRHLFARGQEYAHVGGMWCYRDDDDDAPDAPTRWQACDQVVADILDEFSSAQRTHATALAAVQELHDIAIQQRDQVTKELEETKARVRLAELCARYESDVAGNAIADMKEAKAQLATARSTALREVREKVLNMWDSDGAVERAAVLALLGGDA